MFRMPLSFRALPVLSDISLIYDFPSKLVVASPLFELFLFSGLPANPGRPSY